MNFVKTTIGDRLNGNSDGAKGRYRTLVGKTGDREPDFGTPFFDVYGTEGMKLHEGHPKDDFKPRFGMLPNESFDQAVEYRSFRDAELIQMIQGLSLEVRESVGGIVSAGDRFAFESPSGREGSYSRDVKLAAKNAHNSYNDFLDFLKRVPELIEKYGDRLREWSGLHDVSDISHNIGLVDKVVRNLSVSADTSGSVRGLRDEHVPGLRVQLDRQVATSVEGDFSPLESDCYFAGNAYAEFLQQRGLQPYAQEGLIVATLIEYAHRINQIDGPHYGTHPKVLPPDQRGLRFSFKGLHHPLLLRNGQGGFPGINIYLSTFRECEDVEATIQALAQQGALANLTKEEANREGDKVWRWKEGLSVENVRLALNKLKVNPKLHDALVAHFVEGSSETFGDFSLGETDPETDQQITVSVLPGPNMAGKSTFMKAIALLLHSGLMGRQISAESGEMTVSDQVFHNFNLKDDIQRQRSTFKAQLENIKQFLDNATIHSLGLFDELFNGTSADYQLALAWAFLEECSNRKLRVIVSTHNRELEFFSDPEGYDHIQGSFSRPAKVVKYKGARRAKTVSIGKNRKLQWGAERDSKAFVIAREVLKPDYEDVVDRAEAILAHLRSARSPANTL